MDDLTLDELVIHIDLSAPACLRLDWKGCSNSETPEQIIGQFFEKVLAEAHREGRRIEMHFEAVEHFNSATIATLIHLVYSAGKAKVPLRIYYDADLKWQALAFGALERAVHWTGSGGAEKPNVEFFSIHS